MASRSASIAIRLVLIVPLIGLWYVVHPERSYACSCLEPGSPSEELEEADAVFMGRVVSVREVEKVHGDLTYVDSVITEFDVKTVWKGPVNQTMYIDSGGPCGIGFIEGVEYIVYAYYSDHWDGLATGLCTRTTLLSWAMDDLAGLGAGTTPGQVPTAPRPEPTNTAAPLVTNTPTPQATDTPTPQPTNTAAPQATDTPTPQPTNTAAPQATDTPTPQPTDTPTPDMSETSGGRGLLPYTFAMLVVALLAGLAWFGLRKRRSEST